MIDLKLDVQIKEQIVVFTFFEQTNVVNTSLTLNSQNQQRTFCKLSFSKNVSSSPVSRDPSSCAILSESLNLRVKKIPRSRF